MTAEIRQYMDLVALTKDQERGLLHTVMFELAIRNVSQRRQRMPAFGEEVRAVLSVVNAGRRVGGQISAEKTAASRDHEI